MTDRPAPIPPAEAGRRCLCGWIDPQGRFYAAPWLKHLQVAAVLRASGSGPAEPWRMTDGWLLVRVHGEVVGLANRITQGQLDALADMMLAAPAGMYKSGMLASIRALVGMQMDMTDRMSMGTP